MRTGVRGRGGQVFVVPPTGVRVSGGRASSSYSVGTSTAAAAKNYQLKATSDLVLIAATSSSFGITKGAREDTMDCVDGGGRAGFPLVSMGLAVQVSGLAITTRSGLVHELHLAT